MPEKTKPHLELKLTFLLFLLQLCRETLQVCPHGDVTGSTLATNGNFEGGWTGWTVTGSGGQKNTGSNYNSLWGSSTVIQLDVVNNQIYSQTYTLTQGVYLLRFDYAARVNYTLQTNSMKVYWNGAVVWSLTPLDYGKYTQDVYVDAVAGSNTFGIGGAGSSDGVGMTVDNVAFYKTVYWRYTKVGGNCVCVSGYYAPEAGAECEICSAQFAHCTVCTLGACSTCSAGYTGPQCCSQAYCLECAYNGSDCTACNNTANYFIDTLNPGNCETCSITGCSTCQSLYTCRTCNAAANYFKNSFHTCSLCTLSHCTTCASLYACQTCDNANGWFVNTTSKYCQQCSITGCVTCSTFTECATCNTSANYYKPTTSTVCAYCNPTQNKFINSSNLCETCSLTGCLKCSSLTACSTCNTYNDYKINPNTNLCQHCPLDHCLICANSSSCSVCDADNFYGIDAVSGNVCVPCNQSCTCSGYSLPYLPAENKCTTACGDGFVATPHQECDDGNTANTDGCSQECQVEDGFICTKMDPSSQYSIASNPSVCGVDNFQIQLLSWHENQPYFCDNQIVFEFQFTPYKDPATQILYKQLDYNSVFSTNVSALVLKAAQYSQEKGTVSLIYAYSEDLHGTTASIVFHTIMIPQLMMYSSMQQSVVLNNKAGPVITHEEGTCQNIGGPFLNIGVIAGGVSLGLLLFGIFLKRKLISLELVGVFQIAYYSMANSNFVPLLLTPLISIKNIAVGYNFQMHASMNYPEQYLKSNSLISYQIQAMGYTSETTLNFFANLNLMLIIVLCMPLLALILKASSVAIEKLGTVSLHVLKEVFLTLVMYCAIGFGFTAGLHLNYQRKFYNQYTLTHGYDKYVKINYFYGNLATMVAITLVFSACVLSELGESEGFGEFRSSFKKESKGAKFYLTFSIAFRFIMGLMMAALSDDSNACIATLVLSTIFFIFIIAVLPFKEKLQNARCLAIQGCIVGIIVIQLAINFSANGVRMSSLGRSIGPGITQWALIGGVFIFSIVCIGLALKQKWDKYRKKEKLKDYVYNNKKDVEGSQSQQILPEESIDQLN